jgi:hypothetical protein
MMVANFYDLTTKPMIGQSGPLVLDSNLQPVWFEPVPKDVVASNLEAQTYHGQPVLTWWQGVVSDTGATESGEDIVVNDHYQTIATLRGQDGWVITLHEMIISGGDAWVTANKDVPMDISKYGGSSNGILDDSAVQEYDLATGRLVYSWDALDHLPLTSSHAQPPDNGFPWDAYHVNSISLAAGGDFLVSMRNTWAAYMVSGKTGDILWELGGKNSSFQEPPAASFEWQHDVKLQSPTEVTMFNDDCCEISGAGTYLAPAGPSSGMELKLDFKSHRATLMHKYDYAQGYSAAYMGDMQTLPNGNVFIGWGSQPNFSEYSRSGRLLLDGHFPGPDLSYRAVVAPWTGLPLYSPSGAARPAAHGATVYASWNGATGVTAWRVLAGAGPGTMRAVATVPRNGFETAVHVTAVGSHFQVQALNGAGKAIGTSGMFTAHPGKA